MKRKSWAAVVALALAGAWPALGQNGDSLKGAAILRGRGCTACHAVMGRGGNSASDLTTRNFGAFSPAGFAAELWNHSPEMWSAMDKQGVAQPGMTAKDLRDVFAFLYAVRFFEPAGDGERGRRVFLNKQCHRCHGLVRVEAGGIGPAVPDWPELTDPVRLLEAMWNHGAAMADETRADAVPWPAMTTQELADLLTYVRNLPERPPQLGRLQLGSPNAGMHLFNDLGCIQCHSILETDPDLIPLAPPAGRAYTITGLAVAMWNHEPVMLEWAKETGMEIPKLEEGQMGHLLSYLMEEGFLDRPGNEKRGARLFELRGCQGCHGRAGRPLPRRDWRAADMAAAVWSHGAGMREQMRRDEVRWPLLSEADMADLIAWLHARE